MEALASIRKMNKFILFLAMGINFVHQTLFFWSLGAWILAPFLPVALDVMILLCVKITQTVGVERSSKRNAFMVLIPFVGLSATISYVAPGDPFLRFVFAAIVAEIGLAEWLIASFKIRKADVDKEKAASEGKPKRVMSPESIAKAQETKRLKREAAKAEADRKAEAARKRRETIERRKFEREIDALSTVDDNAPVSPAVFPFDDRAYM